MSDEKKITIDLLAKEGFDLSFVDGAISGFKRLNDIYETEYIWPDEKFGYVDLTYKTFDGEWVEIATMDLAKEGLVSTTVEKGKYTATFPAGQDDNTLTTNVIYELKDNALYYTVEVQNNLDTGLIIGDIAIPFPMNSSFQWGKKPTESVLRHHQISGHNSFIFWMRCNSVGPYLMLTPTGDAKFEYFDRYRGRGPEPTDDQERRRQWRRRHRHFSAYIHSEARGEIAAEKGCNWRQEHTSVTLAPKGAAGDSIAYTFKFQWVNDYEHIRNVLVEEGFIDVQVIPGMTVPSDLYAKFYLKTKQDIKSVVPEFPEETELEYLGEKVENTHIYKVKFNRLGENKLTISYGDGKTTILEFFSTEPVETLINKRGAFIAKRQHRDPSKWYNGLLAEWNNETEVLLGPDNYDNIKGWRIYEVTCDDPGLSKPAFLAAKNAEYPVQEEIEALDYYIENFVWGGLQMTEEEEYPYGIYGIPDWYQNRNSEDDGPGGKTHIWRIYDYPHIIQMYWGMYRVAKNHPEYKTYLERDEYLKRAYRTALALFLIPAEVTGWIAYRTGLYNELVIVDIIDELYKRGWKMQAQRLERHWQKKVQHFVGEESDLFGSEYPFDSTGFESTHALAKYALKNAKKNIEIDPEKKERRRHGITYNQALKFMQRQHEANIFCRGWIETGYYLYGSDYRMGAGADYTLSYMSQMGGWSILDYALHYTDDSYEYLRLGYASYLSSWALMNTGTPETNYGYWFPGKENDGAAGGGFEPGPYGWTWLEQPHHRGSWYYSCEIDLGYCGALRGAATILADDPLFGLFCYGGTYVETDDAYEITMRDGVRRRFHVVKDTGRFNLTIDTDHISAEQPIVVKKDLSEVKFVIESSTIHEHTTTLATTNLPEGKYAIYVDDIHVATIDGSVDNETALTVKPEKVTVAIVKL